jgi:hypothetical protein
VTVNREKAALLVIWGLAASACILVWLQRWPPAPS